MYAGGQKRKIGGKVTHTDLIVPRTEAGKAEFLASTGNHQTVEDYLNAAKGGRRKALTNIVVASTSLDFHRQSSDEFLDSASAADWHKGSFGAADPELASVVKKSGLPTVLPREANEGAFFRAGAGIHMAHEDIDSQHGRGTWRHEFGHHVDYKFRRRRRPSDDGQCDTCHGT